MYKYLFIFKTVDLFGSHNRRSFIFSLLDDPDLISLNVSFSELKKIVHLIFIDGEDYEPSPRERSIVEGKALVTRAISTPNITLKKYYDNLTFLATDFYWPKSS